MKKIKYVQTDLDGAWLPENLATDLEAIAKTLPKECHYRRKSSIVKELVEDERSDISYISTPIIDSEGEIIKSLQCDRYQQNPVILWAHQHDIPAIGRSLWCKRTEDGTLSKSQYAAQDQNEFGYTIWRLIQGGYLNAKSVGMLPTKVRPPNAEESKAGCNLVIEDGILTEYSVCNVPVNKTCLVQAVSTKSLDLPEQLLKDLDLQDLEAIIEAPMESTDATEKQALVLPQIYKFKKRKPKFDYIKALATELGRLKFSPHEIARKALDEIKRRGRA